MYRNLAALTPDDLKILTPGEMEPEDIPRKPGAVMAIFLNTEEGLSLLFTKRSANLEEHAAQISFPGGAVEAADRDFKTAALRETWEEIGIEADELRVISALPRQPVLNTWLIHPFAAWWPSPRPLVPNPAEVDRIIVAPLAELQRQHQRECWLEPNPERSCRYLISGELLWGATARITGRLLDRLLC